MRSPLNRAFQDTKRSYGISVWKVIRKLVVSASTVGFLYLILGGDAAMSEMWVIAAAFGAALAASFLPEFFWNLWLAPHRIIYERLDEMAGTQSTAEVVDEENAGERAEAAQRGHLASMRSKTLLELQDLLQCIESLSRRTSRSTHMPITSDHNFMALKEKYSSWFPPYMEDRDIHTWAGRIIATLKVNDYDVAEKRIMKAVHKESWEGQGDD